MNGMTVLLLVIYYYWQASETLYSGVKLRIGDFCWRVSKASETVLGVDNAKSGICYMDGTYAP